ncbi:MAG TPA: hypothetical protein VMF58_12970 [Rhizomicrobium sp.]|nr:hypothetical protein [Rhizomicrobium sp.]
MTLTEHIQPLLDKRLPAALVAGMLIASGASAREVDHLLPENSIIGGSFDIPEYDNKLRVVFDEAYAGGVKLRMVDLPSFETESVTALKEDKGAYRILTLEPEKQLWTYEALAMAKAGQIKKVAGNDFEHGVRPDKEIAETEAALPADFHDVKIKRCEIAIDEARAERLIAGWKAVLLETKYTQPGEEGVIVTDGVQDHFYVSDGLSDLAGWTAYAPEGGKVAALDGAAVAMFDYCAKHNAAALKKLDSTLADLETRIAPAAGKAPSK